MYWEALASGRPRAMTVRSAVAMCRHLKDLAPPADADNVAIASKAARIAAEVTDISCSRRARACSRRPTRPAGRPGAAALTPLDGGDEPGAVDLQIALGEVRTAQ